MASGTQGRNLCSLDGGGRYGLLQSKGSTMLVQRSGSQAAACRRHQALKTGLRTKYKLPAAHCLLSSFAYGSAKLRDSSLTSKYSASFEETVNIIYPLINFSSKYLFIFRLLSALSLFIDVTSHY